jgi:hypothetical protein
LLRRRERFDGAQMVQTPRSSRHRRAVIENTAAVRHDRRLQGKRRIRL